MSPPVDVLSALPFMGTVVSVCAMVVAVYWLSYRANRHKREHNLEMETMRFRAKRERLYTLAEVAERVQEPMPFTAHDNKTDEYRSMDVDVQESVREKVARDLVENAGLDDVTNRQMTARVEAEERAADGGDA